MADNDMPEDQVLATAVKALKELRPLLAAEGPRWPALNRRAIELISGLDRSRRHWQVEPPFQRYNPPELKSIGTLATEIERLGGGTLLGTHLGDVLKAVEDYVRDFPTELGRHNLEDITKLVHEYRRRAHDPSARQPEPDRDEAPRDGGQPGVASGEDRTGQSTSIAIYIDPGDASESDLRELLLALSDLHVATGGSGLHFEIDGERIYVTEGVLV